ncbi:hypothetical protein GRF59_24795 [Paenibacillus sp. HJL G12]|uniref:YhcN/YlaJ family sporulation lipoprotein n=1 Tax=Paenibacillus dendrobii TaxID=2691084 RepID=A0A7X3IRC4_9BACL|nr:YhcN/YlaJ family sporulation lipoprotein [Paenibacillus dendrobii]MWV46832.1 hypothetical protein [Paenibacillus dendrobii]
MMRSKAISLSISAALLASVAGVTGCTTKEPANTNVRTKNVHDARGLNGMNGRLNVNSLRDGGDRLSTYNTDGTGHNVRNLTSSQELADKVAALKEVRTANVLHGGNSAYVAVSLEDGATKGHMGTKSINGTNGNFRSSSFGTMNNSSFNNNSTSNGSMSTNNRGLYGTMGTGSYGMMRDATGNGTGTTGTGMGTLSTGNGDRIHGYTTSSGEPITKSNGFNATTPGTSGTNETLSDHNAAQDNMSADIKKKISDVIKKADPNITNVYVSANPDFVQRVSNYATDVKNGHPIGGMMSELSTMFERIFPMHTGTDHNVNTNNINNTNRVTPMGNTPTAPLGKTPAGRHMMQ